MKNIQNTPEYNVRRFDLFAILLSVVNDENTANSTNRIIADYLLRNLHRLNVLTITMLQKNVLCPEVLFTAFYDRLVLTSLVTSENISRIPTSITMLIMIM